MNFFIYKSYCNILDPIFIKLYEKSQDLSFLIPTNGKFLFPEILSSKDLDDISKSLCDIL